MTIEAPAGPAPEPAAERRGLNLALPEADPAGTPAEWLQLARFAQRQHLPGDILERALERGLGIDATRAALLDAAAERDERRAIIARPVSITGDSGDDPDFRRRQCEDALAHRLSAGRIALPESARPVRDMTVRAMQDYLGDARGGWLQRAGFAGHVSGDFPLLLLESGQRVLAEAFKIAASPLRQVARTVQVDDFRDITRARRGEAAKLLEINEHGEVQSSTLGEEYERYRVKSYARNFLLTRNAIINDDLDAFADFLADMGRAAAVTEAGVLVGLITGDGVVLADGTSLWHANHGNLAASPAALDVAAVGVARREMRLQRSPTNDEPLNLVPRYLLVPAALETLADQLVAQISATTTSAVNPFASRLEILVEPRLDASSSTAWYVVADPASMPFIEIATLNGSRPMATGGTPELRTFEGEDVLGIKYRAVHDFGAFPVNFRAAFKNAGQ